ncbi:heterokaryon incompatibility protein-domain-containing protein [Pisolithus croceorrhizus]|nr:heterokaryon incompatibility protein-domain-containing protein [Pisolithus croceorrhizus]
MKLLNVEVVLNREKDIQGVQSEYDVLRELDDEITSYAILSHRWGAEVGYEEMTGLMKMEEGKRDEVRQRCGYQKIIKSCEQATKDGHKWLWIDTCCIDKRSSSELSEAINSMYRWYQNAQVCYAYLNDVCESIFPTVQDNELVAPKQVEFFNKDWVSIGNKRRLAPALEDITRIPRDVLTGGLAAKRLSVAPIMSWAAHRKTTRVEDRAYSLMGLFGVNMPMLYGEGRKAFRRLQLEIIRELSDHSIFAWRPWIPRAGSVLAEDPSDFLGCGDVENVEPDDFADTLIKEYIERNGLNDESSRSDFDSRARHQHKLAVLRSTVNLQQFRTFIVNNGHIGMQKWLPSNQSGHHRFGLLRLQLFPDFSRLFIGPNISRF